MRYTTIIDITDFPQVYRNLNARLVYLHLCLKAGYRDDDRDLVRCSLRTLEEDVGISFAAARAAVRCLLKYRLIEPQGNLYKVRKWVELAPISTRAKTVKEAKIMASRELEEKELKERHAAQRKEERERAARDAQNEKENHTSYTRHMEIQIAAYIGGDGSKADIIRRGYKFYLEQCKAIKREPLKNPLA